MKSERFHQGKWRKDHGLSVLLFFLLILESASACSFLSNRSKKILMAMKRNAHTSIQGADPVKVVLYALRPSVVEFCPRAEFQPVRSTLPVTMDDIIFNLSPSKSVLSCFAWRLRAMAGLHHSSSLIHRERLTREKSELSSTGTRMGSWLPDEDSKSEKPKLRQPSLLDNVPLSETWEWSLLLASGSRC